MSHSKRQYDNWILAEQDPQLNVIIAGRFKREPTSLQDKWRLNDEDRARYGEEEYQRRIKEWQEDERRKFEENNY